MKNRWLARLTACLSVALVIAASILSGCDLKDESRDVLVIVNGEPILKEEVEALFEQYEKTGISYDEIVTNSIRDLLLIQWGRETGVTVSENEVEEIILELRKTYPELYGIYLDRYGRTGIKQKFKNIFLYNKSREALTEWIESNLSEEQWDTPEKMNSVIEQMTDEMMSTAEIQYVGESEKAH